MIKKFLAAIFAFTAVVIFCFSFTGCSENKEPTDMVVKISMYHFEEGRNRVTDFIFDENTDEMRMVMNLPTYSIRFIVDSVGLRREKNNVDKNYPDNDKFNRYYEWFSWQYAENPDDDIIDDIIFDVQMENTYTNSQGETIHKEVILDSGRYEITWKIKFGKNDKVRERTIKMYLTLLLY